jgi:adenine-specific DNA-methyltransferase
MNSLIEKEGMAEAGADDLHRPALRHHVWLELQPFVNKRDVKDGKDEDLTAEPEMVKAFRDTWKLGMHSYLSYLRDRLLLARELLHESGSVFVQISDDNLHHVREILDEVLGTRNSVCLVNFVKRTSATADVLSQVNDYNDQLGA